MPYKNDPDRALARAAEKRYNQKHPERCRASSKRYRAAHPERVKEQQKRSGAKHYAANRERKLEQVRQYHANNLEKRLEYVQQYLKTPGGKAAFRRGNAKRRGLLKATDCTLTAEEWQKIKEMNDHKCFYCKKKRKLTMDHVIPLSKGGKHIKENIVPACRSCNSKKGTKILTLL